MLTHERLLELLAYDQKTGNFTWLVSRTPLSSYDDIEVAHNGIPI